MRIALLIIACFSAIAAAEIVDRVIAVVGTSVVKQSDVDREIRLEALMNATPLEMNARARKDAVERLVDQMIIRQELDAGHYEPAPASEVDALRRQLLNARGGQEKVDQALKTYGIRPDQLASYLQWQATVLRFVQLRFGNGDSAETPSNEQFFAWLDQMRKLQRVEVREERLQ